MTYSEVVALLSTHMVPRRDDSGTATELIPMLERFINDAHTDDDHSAGGGSGVGGRESYEEGLVEVMNSAGGV